jgi:hypothetical protein
MFEEGGGEWTTTPFIVTRGGVEGGGGSLRTNGGDAKMGSRRDNRNDDCGCIAS